MKTAHRQAAALKPRYVDDFPSDEPEPEDADWREYPAWAMPGDEQQQEQEQ